MCCFVGGGLIWGIATTLPSPHLLEIGRTEFEKNLRVRGVVVPVSGIKCSTERPHEGDPPGAYLIVGCSADLPNHVAYFDVALSRWGNKIYWTDDLVRK